MKIADNGVPQSQIWCVVETPYEQDRDKGFLFSCPYGYVFRKMWKEAGIPVEPFIMSLSPDLDKPDDDTTMVQYFENLTTKHAPPIIVPLGKRATALLCPETILKKKGKKNAGKAEGSLDKYSSSLLTIPSIKTPHYAIPNLPPNDISANWTYRSIAINIDLGRVRDEFIYWQTNGSLQPLRARTLITEPDYYKLMGILYDFRTGFREGRIQFLSTDIETIRPSKTTKMHKGNPGYPYTISLAPSSDYAVAFSLWDFEPSQLCNVWRELYDILRNIPQIGQNYFSFDAHYLEALGFDVCLDKCQDTLIRHHILWPELEHKLQFLGKQYTRQPYWKDEGKHWSVKQKKQLLHYNALDAACTYEVYLGQEEEFSERPYLR